MADTTKGDSEVQYLGFLAPALMALIAGLVIHSFIIGVNVTDWWKGRSVTPVDHIVTSLGISRLCAQCAGCLVLFMDTLLLRNLNFYVTLLFTGAFYNFFIFANTWLTSLLSIVLCLKISNLHTRLFLYLRRMILHRTGHLIVASVICSILNSLMALCLAITEITTGGTYNTTMANTYNDCFYKYAIYIFTAGSFFPLLFYCISSVLLFTSLYHHTTRMKMSSNLSINLETYYSVMRFVSFTFIYNTLYFIGLFTCNLYYYFHCLGLLWLSIILDLLPLLHSSYLIYRTAKLKDQMSKVLHNVIGLFLQRKNTETRENIEMAAQ